MANAPPDPLFTLAVAYPIDAFDAAPFSFDAAVITGSPVVRLLVRDGAKPGRRERPDRLERWVAISSSSFARDVVAGAPLSVDGKYNPQTAAYLETVTPKMVAEVGRVLALAAGAGERTAPAPAPGARRDAPMGGTRSRRAELSRWRGTAGVTRGTTRRGSGRAGISSGARGWRRRGSAGRARGRRRRGR